MSVTQDGFILTAILFAGMIGSVYISGRVAERRGRSSWGWSFLSALLIGPLAILLLFMLPNRSSADSRTS